MTSLARALLSLMAVLFTWGCVANREPPELDLPPQHAGSKLPYVVEVVAPLSDDELIADTYGLIADDLVADLQETALFSGVARRGNLNDHPDLTLSWLPWENPPPTETWCDGETIWFTLLTAGVIPGCQCSNDGYRMLFRSTRHGEDVRIDFPWERCQWFGWVPVLLNLSPEWRWRVDKRRFVASLRSSIAAKSKSLERLASR